MQIYHLKYNVGTLPEAKLSKIFSLSAPYGFCWGVRDAEPAINH